MISISFKDIIKNDVSTTFLNQLEFADLHIIDGKNIPVIVDDNEVIERAKKANSTMDGVFTRQKVIYVRPEDYGSMPAIGRVMMFDGKQYRVIDATDEAGLFAITIESNRSK